MKKMAYSDFVKYELKKKKKRERKKTRQERSKENSHPFCDGATKKLLQLNQYRYEAGFRIWYWTSTGP